MEFAVTFEEWQTHRSQPTCSQCGSTDPEDVNRFENDGYSLCCNEPIE